MTTEPPKAQAVEMLKNTDKSKTEIARELDLTKQQVAAYEAHLTMGTYDSNDETEVVQPMVSRERDVENYLANNIGKLEDGLTLVEEGQQYQTPIGRIDLLAEDTDGRQVVIELKKGEAKDDALGQLLGYMEEINSMQNDSVRGIIVAEHFSGRLKKAVKRFDDITLYQFEVDYEFKAPGRKHRHLFRIQPL